MDTQNLRTFLTLASVKNFTQTANLMFIAKSTDRSDGQYAFSPCKGRPGNSGGKGYEGAVPSAL